MCVHTKTNLAAVGSWFPGLVHSALALALASIALALGVLAVQPVAGHSFRCVSGFEPTTIGSCVPSSSSDMRSAT